MVAGEAVEKLRQGTEASVDGGDGQEEYFPAYELVAPWLSSYGLRDTGGSIRILPILATKVLNITTCLGPSFLMWEVVRWLSLHPGCSWV